MIPPNSATELSSSEKEEFSKRLDTQLDNASDAAYDWKSTYTVSNIFVTVILTYNSQPTKTND